MMDFERVLTVERVEIRDPRARPSNIWWNIITIRRLLKVESPETTVVIPITSGLSAYGRHESRERADIQIE